MPRSAVAALSGGVDSSVAALLALRAGVCVIGVTLDTPGADSSSARAVCEVLGIEHRQVAAAERFEEQVLRPFVAAWAEGRTPNPCVECNPCVKLATLAAVADELGLEAIITGHYARVYPVEAEFHLLRALDRGKDQSYVLYRVSQAMLARLRLPLGTLTKDEVRERAAQAGLPVLDRPESQDVCFAPDGEVGELVTRACPAAGRPGPIINARGAVIGRHRGLAYYTIGQRRGLGIGGPGGPLYVTRILPERNALVVGPEKGLWVRECTLERVHLIGAPPGPSFAATVMTRYRGTETPAMIELHAGERATVRFERPHRAPAPGQSAVFYAGERVLGGGIIAEQVSEEA